MRHQGRITKVINMKPDELRSMIEETAGTRMFEQKKQAALKTIEKKQAKVDEINNILANDITPMLEKLRQERAEMIKFMANAAECERLTRFCVAHDFSNAERLSMNSAAEVRASTAATVARFEVRASCPFPLSHLSCTHTTRAVGTLTQARQAPCPFFRAGVWGERVASAVSVPVRVWLHVSPSCLLSTWW